MSATGSGYDLSTITFSPDGRVFQIEYAAKAVEKSGTVVGIRCKDGVVMAVEKVITSKMLVPGSNRRILSVDTHCGIAMAGLAADAKQIVNRARSEARSYRQFYGVAIPGSVLADRLAGIMHIHTLYWYLRPFGASVLMCSWHPDDGPQLYMLEPSGAVARYFACAIGKQRNGAMTELEKIKTDALTCKQATVELAKIIYKLHDDVKEKDFELEMSWVCEESGRKHVLVPAEILADAVRVAAEEKRKSEEGDDAADKTKPSPMQIAPSATKA